MTTFSPPRPVVDLSQALIIEQVPGIRWIVGDDLCDCTFQRIGDWTNSYIGRTKRVRLCCIWAEIEKQYPQFVQDIPMGFDENSESYLPEPVAWDNEEMPMPVGIWYRQLAQKTGRALADIRAEYRNRLHERPGPVARGTGLQSRPKPSPASLAAALHKRLVAAGWFLK
jgi:hypothetical protein